MSVITSTQAGNWSSGSTWVGGVAPTTGDTAVINHAVAVDANTTVGTSPSSAPSTALTLNSTGGGSSGGSLQAATYVPVYTQVDTNGNESAPCGVISGSMVVASGNIPRITFPSLASGIASYNVYFSNSGGNGPYYRYATGITTTTFDCSVAFSTGNPQVTSVAFGVTINATKTLTINAGITLTIKGNLGMAGNLTMGAGSSLVFDGSSSLQGGAYQWLTEWTGNTATITVNGTSGSHASISSTGGSANSYTAHVIGSGGGGTVVHSITYCDFTAFGSSTSKQCLIFNRQSGGSATQALANCTFDSTCGLVDTDTTMQVVDGYSITDCVFNQTIKPLQVIVSGTANGGVTRSILRTVFAVGAPTLYMGSATYTDLYFGNGLDPHLAGGPASVSSLFVKQTGTVGGFSIYGDWTDAHLVCDTATNNPHFSTPSSTNTLQGFIAEYTASDSQGDVFAGAGTSITVTIQQCLVLPNSAGLPSGSFTNFGNSGVSMIANLYHNTYPVGTSSDGVIYNDYSTPNAGLYANLKSNLSYIPSGGSTSGYKLKVDSVANHSNPMLGTEDILNGANATNNAMGSFDAGLAGKGYNAWCSVTPGANDVDLSTTGPLFVDQTRNFATYDSAASGLNNSAASWVTSHSYVVGDVVSAQTSAYYGNAVINYRCITAHTSNSGNATNGQPGSAAATSWRTNWEFATAYRLRTDYTKIAALRTWIRGGFAPQNLALKGTAHDGGDIGAVNVLSIVQRHHMVLPRMDIGKISWIALLLGSPALWRWSRFKNRKGEAIGQGSPPPPATARNGQLSTSGAIRTQ